MRKTLIFINLLIILLTSCTVSEQINLNTSTNGQIKSDIIVEDFFVAVIEDFSEFLPATNESILDGGIRDFTNQIGRTEAATDAKYTETEENHYLVDVSFSDLNQLIAALSGGIDLTILNLD